MVNAKLFSLLSSIVFVISSTILRTIACNVASLTAIHIFTFFLSSSISSMLSSSHRYRYHRRHILSATLLFREFQKGLTLASAASVSISFVFFVSSAAATLTAKTASPWPIEDAFKSC